MTKNLLITLASIVLMIMPCLAADAVHTSGSGPYTALLRTTSGGFTTQAYMDVHGLAIAEGDIVLGQHADVQKETLRNLRELAHGLDPTAAGLDPKSLDALVPMSLPAPSLGPIRPFSLGLGNLWPNKTVPFDIDPAIGPAHAGHVSATRCRGSPRPVGRSRYVADLRHEPTRPQREEHDSPVARLLALPDRP